MAAVQTTYSETMRAGLPGMVANAETKNIISRTASGTVEFGQPVRRDGDHKAIKIDELTMTPVAANGVPAPAGATIGSVTAAPPAKAGQYSIRATVGGAGTASKWEVRDPDGEVIGVASGNTAFSAQGIGFTITDAGTDPVVGEQFVIDVTAEAEGSGGFLGLSVRDPSLPVANADVYLVNDNMAILTQGVMWVTAGDTVAAGEQVYWDDADSRYTNEVTDYPIPGGRFDSAAVDGGIVKIAFRAQYPLA